MMKAAASNHRPRKAIFDWETARARLFNLETMLAENSAPSRERAQEVLEERARRLAAVPRVAETQDQLELIGFDLGAEHYGLEVAYLREVVRVGAMTRVPRAPAFVRGVLSLRGNMLTVFDLRQLLGVASSERDGDDHARARVLVLGRQSAEVGLHVDLVGDVVRVPATGLSDAGSVGKRNERRHVRGLTADALIVLDGAVLLDDPELIVGTNAGSNP